MVVFSMELSPEHRERLCPVTGVARCGKDLPIARILCRFLALLICTLLGCSATHHAGDDLARNAALVGELNSWLKEITDAPPPEKPGTVTPAHDLTFRGRVHHLQKHVQTKKEYQDQLDDARWAAHMRNIVKGFAVTPNTVTVITDLTRDSTFALSLSDKRDAQELCHDLGGFVWAAKNRHWGLENIKVVGANGEVLSSRMGLKGRVQ